MKGNDSVNIVVADSCPIIRTGIAMTLRRLSSLRINAIETSSYEDLSSCIESSNPQLLIVNPTLGGGFDPSRLRHNSDDSIKIMAIEIVPLPRSTRNLFDGTISIADDSQVIENKISELVRSSRGKEEEKETLSQRETEIVSLVVKGLTNKKIAEKLFLSVHTVITHRRNIARKLEIHSATGLTIYAIVNGIVDPSDVKL